MDATTATDFITTNKGTEITVHLVDGGMSTGSALSVNSKGVNIKRDGKTISFNLKKVDRLSTVGVVTSDDDEEIMAHDGMTTRELADILGTDPKSLRVILRSLGLGVGKGRKYSLAVSDLVNVRKAISANV